MRIVILTAGQTLAEIALRHGEFDRMIRDGTGGAWTGSWAVRDLRLDSPLPGPRDADAYVMTGSSASVTEQSHWMLRAEELVRRIAAAQVPLLGICFGHQLMAKALGGTVIRNPSGPEEGVVRLTRLLDDPLFAGLPRAFDVRTTHDDTVAALPPGAELLAQTSLDAVAAFRVGRHLRGVQFHPEFDADVLRGYLGARDVQVPGGEPDPGALLKHVEGGARGREILANFAKMVVGRGGRVP